MIRDALCKICSTLLCSNGAHAFALTVQSHYQSRHPFEWEKLLKFKAQGETLRASNYAERIITDKDYLL